MEPPRIRSRILVVALLLFVTGSALAWNRTYRHATSPTEPRVNEDRYVVLEHGGRIVADAPVRNRRTLQANPKPEPLRADRPKPRPDPEPLPVVRTVQVKNGDNLHRVAKRALGRASRWREIADLNGLSAPYVIQPGQSLEVPPR